MSPSESPSPSAGPGVYTYYFDASDAAATDPNGFWTNDANAFDNDPIPSTRALQADGQTGSTSTGYLMAEGTNAPDSTATISQVEVRIYGQVEQPTGTNTIFAAVYTDALAELLGTATVVQGPSSSGWGSYTALSTPSGGWTWAKIQALEVKVYGTTGELSTMSVYKVGVQVTTISGPSLSPSESPSVSPSPSLSPSASPSVCISEIKTISNLDKSLIKTVNGLAKESISEVNGLILNC